MTKNFVEVKILDLPASGGGCSCNAAPRGPEMMQVFIRKCSELKDELQARYPGKTRLQVVDLTISPEEKATEAGQMLINKTSPAPLVLIDGQARFAGSIQVNRIVKEVGEILNSFKVKEDN